MVTYKWLKKTPQIETCSYFKDSLAEINLIPDLLLNRSFPHRDD